MDADLLTRENRHEKGGKGAYEFYPGSAPQKGRWLPD
jgi:hypothetical protein